MLNHCAVLHDQCVSMPSLSVFLRLLVFFLLWIVSSLIILIVCFLRC
jgi:hypothetical protein